jgi:uncharacterized membrane protein
MSGILYAATLVTALGCGLVAGVFFAFSRFVMPALKRLTPERGVTPVFMTALFGTAVACLGLAAWTVISSDGRTTALVLLGGALYLVGAIGVTVVCNVPLNNRLAKLHPQSAASYWDEYLTQWTAWNHLRTLAALAAAALLTIALHL